MYNIHLPHLGWFLSKNYWQQLATKSEVEKTLTDPLSLLRLRNSVTDPLSLPTTATASSLLHCASLCLRCFSCSIKVCKGIISPKKILWEIKSNSALPPAMPLTSAAARLVCLPTSPPWRRGRWGWWCWWSCLLANLTFLEERREGWRRQDPRLTWKSGLGNLTRPIYRRAIGGRDSLRWFF